MLIGFVSFGLQAQNNESLFDKLSDTKGVTRVIVSKTLLRMSGSMDMGFNTKNLSNKLDKIEIYTSENKSAASVMKQEMLKFNNDPNYEELVNIKEDGETTIIYSKLGDKGLFKETILFTDDGYECSIIRMIGAFSLDDVQGIAGSKK